MRVQHITFKANEQLFPPRVRMAEGGPRLSIVIQFCKEFVSSEFVNINNFNLTNLNEVWIKWNDLRKIRKISKMSERIYQLSIILSKSYRASN